MQYLEEPKLCVVSAIKQYMIQTKHLRGNTHQLFISVQKPHKAVTKATISCWIKRILTAAGIDMFIFSPNSTRAAATSAAKRASIPLQIILNTVGGKTDTTFAHYYIKTLCESNSLIVQKQNV